MPLPVLATTALGGLGTLLVYAVGTGVGQGIAKAAVGLGVGFVAFQGADTLVTQNKAQVMQLINLLPPVAVQLIGVLKIGTCLNIMFSAMLMKLSIFGLNEGVIKRMRVTGPPASGS
jgi:hypothetical protein